jgi:hypothetical protein
MSKDKKKQPVKGYTDINRLCEKLDKDEKAQRRMEYLKGGSTAHKQEEKTKEKT